MGYENTINNKFSEPAVIISCKDDEIKVLEINDRFIPELWMNVSKDEFIGSYPGKTLDKENMQIYMQAVKKCIDTGEEQTIETWRDIYSDCCGQDRICLKSRFVLLDKTPEEAVLFEGARNISNERRMLDIYADMEYRYKQTSEQVNIYNWEYIIDTKEMRPCYRCMRDLGLPALVTNYPEPAIDMGIFPPDYADMYREMLRKVDSGVPELEADIPLTVGRVPFRVKYTTEFDEQGKPVKAFGSATLISETELGHIKLDNQIISTLAEGYGCIYLLDFVSDTVKLIKQDGIFDIKEDAGCDGVLKTVASRLCDTANEQIKLLDNIDAVRTKLLSDSEQREFVYKDDKQDKWIRIGYYVTERGKNKVDRILITASVVDDIRAQKMDADRLIASQKEELEDRQKKLITAIEEANRANKAKTEFFSNMSHDIRTPMSAITGFSRLAMDEINNREHLEDYLDKIVVAGDHLMNLLNDILDMSRIESGKMELATASVVLKDLLYECADMVRIKMSENKLDFTVNVDDMGSDAVVCDRLRFNQVVLNLLSNAYKFTPEGGKVFLQGRLIARGEQLTYEIRVKDTGIGMSAEFKDHIWEAYSREKSETVNKTQGTGLGMAIVKSIIELMHGTISLDTRPGEGSEFVIVLPVKPAPKTAADKMEDNVEDTDDVLKRSYKGITVLVVDDTPLNLKLADRLLEKYGFTVKLAESGMNAISMVKESKPGEINIILMDVMMPVMDGYEATKRIRALDDPQLSQIPIIAMTANAFASDVQAAADAGMNAHISKPFLPKDLVTTINANL